MGWILVGVKVRMLNTCYLVIMLRCNKHVGYLSRCVKLMDMTDLM